jgi:signal transduction histidine kinase/DNA-binding response OmpR family regulator
MLSARLFLFITLLILGIQVLNAQDFGTEKAIVTHKSSFTSYPNYPVSCFRQMYIDEDGKIWLTECGISAFTVNGIYNFDGYEFRYHELFGSILGDTQKNITGLSGNRLYGYDYSEQGQRLFYYDLNKKAITVYDTLNKNISKAYSYYERSIFQNIEDENIYTYVYNDDHVQLYIYDRMHKSKSYPRIDLTDYGIELQRDFPYTNDIFIENREWLIHCDILKKRFVVINLRDGSQTHIPAPISGDYKNLISIGRKKVKDYILLSFNYANKPSVGYVYKIKDSPSPTLEFIEKFNNVDNRWGYFIDNYENRITYSQKEGKYYAELKTKDGKIYDVSELLDDFNVDKVDQIQGENFLDNIYLLSARVFSLKKIKINTDIKQIKTGTSTRGIASLSDGTIIYQEELKDDSMGLNSASGKTDEGLCNFNSTTLKSKGQYIWGIADGNLSRYDKIQQECAVFKTEQEVHFFTVDDKEHLYFMDNTHRIWEYKTSFSAPKPLLHKGENIDIVTSFPTLLTDDEGMLWIGCHLGLFKYDLSTQTLTHINKLVKDFNFNITSLLQSNSNDLLLGTFNSGVIVFNKKTNEYYAIDKEKGLCHNTVASITEDNAGNFWIGTYKGVGILDANYKLLHNLYETEGLVNNECNRKSATLLQNGNLAIGSIDGISVLVPESIIKDFKERKDINVYFSKIEYYDAGLKEEISISENLNTINALKLDPADNRLRLEFATTNYIDPLQNKYSYKIEGAHDDWVELGTTRTLALSSLAPGEYNIQIRGGDLYGNWSKNILMLNVSVDTYFYQEIWFYLLLLIVLFIISVVWVNMLRSRVKIATSKINKDKLTIEEQAQKLKKLDQAKSRFFTNITHEFRTPITIIKSVVDLIKSNNEQKHTTELNEIEKNSDQLLEMVNQILDLRKLESNKMKLDLIQSDILTYIDYIIDSHQYPAKKKSIKLKLIRPEQPILMDFDVNKIKTILTNLLSNAIKYTPKTGEIGVRVEKSKDDKNLLISIQDTGVGISDEDAKKVFDYFQQSDTIFKSNDSSGIGLSLAQQLVEFLGGSIALQSKPNEGTLISINLPITYKAENVSLIQENIEPSGSLINLTKANTAKKEITSILIVEDNDSLREILRLQLKAFHIYTAADGKEGEKIAIEQVPDVIISDVMMPHKNGYQLCESLKNDKRTSHIPIILLTAKADQPSKIEGLKAKADVYLSKPYDLEELKLSIKNLCETRQQLQKYFKNFDEQSTPTEQPLEDRFILELRTLILYNLRNEDFGIQHICKKMKVSRTQLHNKLKALTGHTTSHYILSVRLNEAKKLLKHSSKDVSEISFDVGITNLSYFSRKFKEAFGSSPSEFKKK